MQFEDTIVEEEDIRREKEKARRLRQTAWWMRKIQRGVCHYCQSQVGREHLTMDHGSRMQDLQQQEEVFASRRVG
jgi:hypothetical protein